jgi:hypothetical protein
MNIYRCETFDEFISKNEPATPRQRFYFQMSPFDLQERRKLLAKIKSCDAPYYEFFGSNAARNISFALYKSKNCKLCQLLEKGIKQSGSKNLTR